MELSTELILTVGTILVSVGGSWGVSKWRMDRYEKDRDQDKVDLAGKEKAMWGVITKIRDGQVEHDKESSEKRVEYEKRFGELAAGIARSESQYDTLTKHVDAIDSKLDRIDGKLDRMIQTGFQK